MRETEKDRGRLRETERDIQREREIQRQRQRQGQRQRERVDICVLSDPNNTFGYDGIFHFLLTLSRHIF